MSCFYSNYSFIYQASQSNTSNTSSSQSITSTTATTSSTTSSITIPYTTSTSLPSNLYLDYLEIFQFKLVLNQSNWSSVDPGISFTASNSSAFSITSSNPIKDYIRQTISYTVSINDLGVARSTQFLNSQMTILLNADLTGCVDQVRDRRTDSQKFINKTIALNSGCHPTTLLSFSPSSSSGIIYPCPYSTGDIPCALFRTSTIDTNTDFVPVFYLSDYSQLINTTYTDAYTFQVIGGGKSKQDIVMYTSAEVATFNPPSSNQFNQIWSSKGSTSIYTSTNVSITWTCQPNSPCNSPSTVAMYYLIVQIVTTPLDSYCTLSNTFSIVLVGVPVAIQWQLIAMVATMVGCGILTIMYMWTRRVALGVGVSRKVVPIKRGVSFSMPETHTRKIMFAESVGMVDEVVEDGEESEDGEDVESVDEDEIEDKT